MKSLCIVLIALGSTFSVASAQQPAGTWRHFTNSNGVNCMIADGPYLWLGTDGGLVKYDRRVDTFTVLAPWNSGLPTLQVNLLLRDQQGGIWVRTFNSNWVRLLNGTWSPMNVPIDGSVAACDSAGRVWMGGSGGLGKYANGAWTIYTDSTSPLASNNILSLSANRSGAIWILTDKQKDTTMHGSLLKTDGDTYWEAHNIKTDPSFDTSTGLGTVFASRDGSIWLKPAGISSILYHVHASKWDTIPVQPGGQWNDIIGMTEDANGLWICDGYGAGHFDGHTWTVLDSAAGFPFYWPHGMISDGSEQWFISPKGITDGSGITSPGGLAKFSNGTWKRYDSLSNCTLRGRNIQALTTDRKGRYWFGEHDGTRISSFDGTHWTGYDSLTANGVNANYIFVLASDSSDNVWIASKDLLKFDGVSTHSYDLGKLVPHPDSTAPFSHNVNAIACDKHGNVWVGTVPPGWSGLAKFDGTSWTPYQMTNSPMPDINVDALAIDHDGNIWIATAYGGIVRFDGQSDWKIFNTSNSAIPSNAIGKIEIAPNGDVWIATSSGAAKWNGTTWTSYAAANPIAPDNLATLAADIHGNIWFGGFSAYVASGASEFDGTNWTMFSTQNSLVGTNFTENMMAGKNGEIWIGTYDAGVVEYIPASPAVVMPPAQIESQSFVSYPNPASAAVRCQVGGIGEAPAIVTILDLLGRTVMSFNVANAGDFSLDTRSLPDGVYTIVAKSESHVGRGQFIVAR